MSKPREVSRLLRLSRNSEWSSAIRILMGLSSSGERRLPSGFVPDIF
jgi:hypothetical protein